MSFLFDSQPAQAFWFGILSAVSLPIGAILGIWLKPSKKIVAAIMAFGAGSLLAALTLELTAPALEHAGFWPLATGCILGGAIFVLLNQALNSKGAFLRKPATLIRHLLRSKKKYIHDMVEDLSKVDLLRALPPSEMQALIPYVNGKVFPKDYSIFKEGDEPTALYLIQEGKIEVVRKGNVISELKNGDVFGEMSLLSGNTRTASITTLSKVKVWRILKCDFDKLLNVSPILRDSVQKLSVAREKANSDFDTGQSNEWKDDVMKQVGAITVTFSGRDVKEAAKKHGAGGAAFAIWLGILLDGIPESAVIGASMLHASVSLALIVGLFLANLPEAMSSAVGMRQQNASISKIMWMWSSLCILTGIGALLGNIFFRGTSPALLAGFEGCAAGAMLAMIAETMLPEAYEQGGAIVGMSTLLGFLAAIFVKSFG